MGTILINNLTVAEIIIERGSWSALLASVVQDTSENMQLVCFARQSGVVSYIDATIGRTKEIETVHRA